MRRSLLVSIITLAALGGVSPANAASPGQATLTPNAEGKGSLGWTGTASLGAAALADSGDVCFGGDGRPDPSSGCDVFTLDVNVPQNFYDTHRGSVEVSLTNLGLSDLDLYIYERNDDGTVGNFVIASGNLIGEDEVAAIDSAEGSYYVAAVPYTVIGSQDYQGTASMVAEKATPATLVQKKAPPGFLNIRASHDQYTSHSEPTIAMDPTDHNHLIAGSKMYENNDKYLFKIGTYESHDGGRHWKDLGQLPGYCQEAGQCDPNNEALYRTTSDVSMAFDDEGNAYANVLDAPGGTFAFQGFNMTVHIKHPGEPWSGPITVHDNRNNPVTQQALLDDKNWLAVDNTQDANGGPNRPGDGKVGPMYVCWSLDSALPDVAVQAIVLMRSYDGGKTWGGLLGAGDNLPLPLTPKAYIGGVGCHIAIGPQGQVYVTWYDNQLDTLFNVVSTDRGRTFSLPRAVGSIVGVNEPFSGQAFRNLSIPATAVDQRNGDVYIAVSSCGGQGSVFAFAEKRAEELAEGVKKRELPSAEEEEQGSTVPGACSDSASGSDIVLFKSSDGGSSWSGPVRVNQDPGDNHADQFQPWIAVTPKGQVDVSYFDRRNDSKDYFIDTWLSRSNDGGHSFHDTRVSQRPWDPAINAPISVSGQFIGDYQGLVADDNVAIPAWNDTQLATNLKKGTPGYSQWQELMIARVPNGPASFISSPKLNGVVRARRGPAAVTLRGSASDPSGGTLRRVRVALLRRRGGHCQYYSARTRRFVRGSCAKPSYIRARGVASWRAAFPRRALRGGYTYSVLASAVNTAGKVEKPDERGRNRVTFRLG